jgi:hypothetical protein
VTRPAPEPLALALALALAAGLAPPPAAASGKDFVNEALVARSNRSRELGLEWGADSRVDRDYRLQGWFLAEAELGITRAWMLEGGASWVHRGRGLELGVFKAETRYVVIDQGRWPAAVAAFGEYETETSAAKHLSLERLVTGGIAVTRTFAGSVLATVNVGRQRRLVPVRGTGRMLAWGVRYPEGSPLSVGFSYRSERLEQRTRLGPELRLRFPNGMLLRLGSSFHRAPGPYRVVGSAILEMDL